MLTRIYIILGGGLLALYTMSSALGWEFGHPKRQVVGPQARSAGWARSPVFLWHSTYSGGK